ncbi:MAG: cytochrome c oxidase assembly protein subunit 15 [Flavobacterium sp.]|jgi:cytochrome c oxidase assembly protein subunit 15
MKKYFTFTAKTTLVLVYLVIIAGALVRMTGSGMGCPDWPKCFGYYIPPTDIKELTWTPDRDFEEGQVIIKDDKLWVANGNFKTQNIFDQHQWRLYTKHDYALFNATETWIEYINRLVGALAGVVIFLMAVFSIGYWKSDKKITLLSWASVLMIGFQGWLGARVVYSVLNPVKITIHMIVALFIVALLIYLIKKTSGNINHFKKNTVFKKVVLLTLILTFVQIVLGTQVRQYVDGQVKLLGYDQMALVLQNPTLIFYTHRSSSLLILGLNLFLFVKNRKLKLGFKKINWVMLLIGIEILSGMAMYYFDFPFASQPLHLILASLLFGAQTYLYLETTDIE